MDVPTSFPQRGAFIPQFQWICMDSPSSKISDVHDKLVIEVMQTDNDKKDQIIKNISKVTTIKDK